MPTNDIRSNLREEIVLRRNIPSNATHIGIVQDTAKFDMGVMFTPMIAPFTQGTYTFSLFEDDDISFSSPTLVPDENLIGTPPTITSQTMQGEVMATFGVFGTKRFLRIQVVATGVAGDNQMTIISTMAGENLAIDSP